jgi:hypothetical protein
MAAHEADANLDPLLRAFLFSSNMRREVGPSTVTGFSMNTLMPFSMAYL